MKTKDFKFEAANREAASREMSYVFIQMKKNFSKENII